MIKPSNCATQALNQTHVKAQEEENEPRIHLTPTFDVSPEQNMSEQDESQVEAEASSDMIEY